jgi:hypothetical protein
MKIPITPSGIELVTFWFLSQCLKHLRCHVHDEKRVLKLTKNENDRKQEKKKKKRRRRRRRWWWW